MKATLFVAASALLACALPAAAQGSAASTSPSAPAAPSARGAAAAASAAHRPLDDADAFARDAERFVDDALARVGVVPGIALAVAVDDRVVLARGFGHADPERSVPADGDTVYYIASSTKSFTALAAALLDARGAVDLDDTLAAHLDGVTMDPALRPGDVRLRDLLTHTSGIANGPITSRLAYSGEHDPDTLWRLLARSTPAEGAPLGTFRYGNAGYNILWLILDRETGTRWQDVLRDEVLGPAGMTRTTAYASLPRAKGWTLAPPCFALGREGLHRLDLEKQDDTMQSAGGLMTTAHDLGRWLVLQLNDGSIDGRQVFPADVVRATHERAVETRDDGPGFGRTGYALGWFTGEFAGREVLHHGGSFPGYRAIVSFLPEARVGVAVMVNEDSAGSELLDVLSAWSYEWWLDLPAGERTAAAKLDELLVRMPEMSERYDAMRERLAARTWQLARPRADYAGTYVSDDWGMLTIALRGDDIVVTAGNLRCTATPFTDPETLRVELVPRSGQVVAFEPATGPIERLRIDGDAYERVR